MLYYIYILKATSIICCDIKLKIVNSFLGLNLVKIFQQFLFQNFFLKNYLWIKTPHNGLY